MALKYNLIDNCRNKISHSFLKVKLVAEMHSVKVVTYVRAEIMQVPLVYVPCLNPGIPD
jgi:hypothetical protein